MFKFKLEVRFFKEANSQRFEWFDLLSIDPSSDKFSWSRSRNEPRNAPHTC
jgi:hypothetical protein